MWSVKAFESVELEILKKMIPVNQLLVKLLPRRAKYRTTRKFTYAIASDSPFCRITAVILFSRLLSTCQQPGNCYMWFRHQATVTFLQSPGSNKDSTTTLPSRKELVPMTEMNAWTSFENNCWTIKKRCQVECSLSFRAEMFKLEYKMFL